MTGYWLVGGVANQVRAKGFDATAPKQYRGIRGHNFNAFIWACPSVGFSTELFNEASSKPPADPDPVPVTTITFP